MVESLFTQKHKQVLEQQCFSLRLCAEEQSGRQSFPLIHSLHSCLISQVTMISSVLDLSLSGHLHPMVTTKFYSLLCFSIFVFLHCNSVRIGKLIKTGEKVQSYSQFKRIQIHWHIFPRFHFNNDMDTCHRQKIFFR